MGNLTKPCNIVINAIPECRHARRRPRPRRRVASNQDGGSSIEIFQRWARWCLAPYVLLMLAIWPQGIMKILYRQNAGQFMSAICNGSFAIQYPRACSADTSRTCLGTYLNAMEETRYNFISSIINTDCGLA